MAEHRHDTTARAFFESVYEASEDPWSFATDPYEQGRYRHIVSLLGDRTFARGFEPGCSVGVLTEMLAPHCEHLLATDISTVAVGRARARCAALPQVEVRQGALPDDLPTAPVDLVVLSEIGYYFDEVALAGVVAGVAERLTADGVLIAAHWTGHSPDHVLSGHDVHRLLDAAPGLRRIAGESRPGYLIGRYHRRSRGSMFGR
jgi:predicted TPR repeat methyltransferase